jgi:hypothetical protein
MKALVLSLVLSLLSTQAVAGVIIQCKVLKDGRSIVHSLSLNPKARRDLSTIWGPAKTSRFVVNDVAGNSTPMTLDVRMEGENQIAVALFKGKETLAQRREVISSWRPFNFTVSSQEDNGMSVACARR